jgi:DNA-binding NarL/FixJ family response regulator
MLVILMIRDILQTKDIDVLILDLELVFPVFLKSNQFEKFFQDKIIIFSGLSEQIYAPNAIKAGVSGFVHKTENWKP